MIARILLAFLAGVAVGVVVTTLVGSTDAQANITLNIRETRAGPHHIRISHCDWPGNEWTLRLPEYLVVHRQVDKEVTPAATKNEDGSVTLSGAKTSHGEMEYAFVLRPGLDKIDLEATITNTGRRPLGKSSSALACLLFADADDFFDENAKATFVLLDGELTSIAELGLRHGSPQDFRHNSHALRAADAEWLESRNSPVPQVPLEAGLIIRSTADGTRHVAQVWDDVFSVAYNFQRDLNCAHANPRFGSVGPGKTRTLRGRIYFFTGSIEDLYSVVEGEFPGLGLEPVSR